MSENVQHTLLQLPCVKQGNSIAASKFLFAHSLLDCSNARKGSERGTVFHCAGNLHRVCIDSGGGGVTNRGRGREREREREREIVRERWGERERESDRE